MNKEFDNAITVLPKKLKEILFNIPEHIKEQTFEIRLRADKPLILYGVFGTVFVSANTMISGIDCKNAVLISNEDVHKTILSICGYSLYSHQNDLANGFITFGNGNRAGVCGTAVIKDQEISAVSNITSVNIRIARNYPDCAEALLSFLDNSFKGLIVAGPPCSGKTTLLKSISYKLSSEYKYGFRKCVLIDERYEMGITNGINLDVLSGYPKSAGINHAIRVLSPEIVVCDEITTLNEAENIIKGMDSGVKFIVSIHAQNEAELLRREVARKLLNSGCFDCAVILNEKPFPCTIDRILTGKELISENCRYNTDFDKHIHYSISGCEKRAASL